MKILNYIYGKNDIFKLNQQSWHYFLKEVLVDLCFTTIIHIAAFERVVFTVLLLQPFYR